MGSLKQSLKEAGITGGEAAYIARKAQEYKDEGFGPQEAHERAIKDAIREFEQLTTEIGDTKQ